MTRPLRLTALVAVVLFACAAPAAAHGATGILGIEATPGAAPLSADVRVLLEYANDREVVAGATVVATATGPDGQTVAATPLADQGTGVYEGTLTMPTAGAWTVIVTATEPAATQQATVTVSATGTTRATTTTVTGDLGDARTSSDRVSRSETSGDGGGGSSTTLILGVTVVLVAAAAGAFVMVRRRARP